MLLELVLQWQISNIAQFRSIVQIVHTYCREHQILKSIIEENMGGGIRVQIKWINIKSQKINKQRNKNIHLKVN
jgi:hypothetical protein